jgi:hypothetical protein
MAGNETVAAILAAVLTVQAKTGPADIAEAVKTYHACLAVLEHYADVPIEARWSAAAEHRRLSGEAPDKP